MNKVAFGLIGCGDIAQKRVAPAMRDLQNCELIAVSRAQSELAASFASQFGARRWYAGWRELINDHEVQAVYIATPVNLHVKQTIAAAEAGKHVLCEKPMALNVDECNRMLDACRNNNVKLGIAYYRHFYPVVRRLKQIIGSGEIGKPVVAQINAFEWFDPPPTHPRSWLLNKGQSGGGPMFDFGCHRIEVLLDLFGEVRDVKSTVSNNFFKREVEDVAVATFQFTQGVCATLTVAHSASEPQDTLDVYGTKGSLHVKVLNEGTLHVSSEAGERVESLAPHSNIHAPLIEDFANAVIQDREPVVTGEIGRSVAELEEQIFRSANLQVGKADPVPAGRSSAT